MFIIYQKIASLNLPFKVNLSLELLPLNKTTITAQPIVKKIVRKYRQCNNFLSKYSTKNKENIRIWYFQLYVQLDNQFYKVKI